MKINLTHTTYLKKSRRSPSWLVFIVLLTPPACIKPKIITAITEKVVKAL